MTDYTELVNALREYAYRRCPLEEKAGICGNHDALKAADAIEELQRDRDAWKRLAEGDVE